MPIKPKDPSDPAYQRTTPVPHGPPPKKKEAPAPAVNPGKAPK